jgi:hypothetical protein
MYILKTYNLHKLNLKGKKNLKLHVGLTTLQKVTRAPLDHCFFIFFLKIYF